jgi:hypothetical protein
MPLLELVAFLDFHFKNPDKLVWIDIFSINQHGKLESEDWFNAMKAAISQAGHTLIVLHPYNLALTRAWCQYDTYHSGKV